VILSQDLLWQLPDWTAAGLSGLIITQATSWQWVPFDCLLPGMSQASGAVVQVMMVLVLPCEFCNGLTKSVTDLDFLLKPWSRWGLCCLMKPWSRWGLCCLVKPWLVLPC